MGGLALDPYRRKRDFSATPEPSGRARAARDGAAYVIQKHRARHLHYDFRLELDGVLKSWALPKGPPLEPGQRRLAVHVEDHPLEYGGFEGVIPAGHYGAGTVEIWDRGRWTPEGDPRTAYAEGKLSFTLAGERLRGPFTLVRTRQAAEARPEQWLLLRSAPRAAPAAPARAVSRRAGGIRRAGRSLPAPVAALPGARAAALPRQQSPQLATLVEAPPRDGAEWLYEVKFDGYRLLARVDGAEARLFTRQGKDWTARLPAQAGAIAALGLRSAWLDGELVMPTDGGRSSFQGLQNAFDRERTAALRYFVFDLLHLDGIDLRGCRLTDRRAVLAELLAGASGTLQYSEAFAAPGGDLLRAACELGLEGVIGKRADSPYVAGRTRTWIKLKCRRRQEFVICGYTAPQGSRSRFGALVLAVHDDDRLRYAGRVGTGFDETSLRALHARMRPLERAAPPVVDPPKGADARGVQWIEPTLVAEVEFAEWTDEGRVRHASFVGLREDKAARAVQRERAAAPARPRAQGGAAARGKPVLQGVTITHPDRVIDLESGATKLDLARYYAGIADRMLPHLKDRPVALLRAPEGLGGGTFFQKHLGQAWIPGARTVAGVDGDPLIVIDTPRALVGAVQYGAIEFHTWNGRIDRLERPDRMIFDLDPDPALPWRAVQEAARLTKALLDQLGLAAWLKTSGGRGLHLVVPLRRRHGWDEVKAVSQAVSRHLARTLPARFSARAGPRNRVGKVFVDYLRNQRGATTVAAYSARARPGLPVSVPIAWGALAGLSSSSRWDISTLTGRRPPRDPSRDCTGQTLGAAAKALGIEQA